MIFFHLLRRFWNQIFTCVSVNRNEAANPARSDELKYLFSWQRNAIRIEHSWNDRKKTYFLISKVDSNWNTCAREKTVLVFLLRLQCINWLLLSVDLSIDSSSSSSSIDSLTSSSDSCDEFNCRFGDEVVVAVFGELVTDADCLSGVLISAIVIKLNQLFRMAALLRFY